MINKFIIKKKSNWTTVFSVQFVSKFQMPQTWIKNWHVAFAYSHPNIHSYKSRIVKLKKPTRRASISIVLLSCIFLLFRKVFLAYFVCYTSLIFNNTIHIHFNHDFSKLIMFFSNLFSRIHLAFCNINIFFFYYCWWFFI